MSQNTNNSDNQDIDLSMLSKKIGSFLESITTGLYNWILFFKKKALLIVGLAVIGAGLGSYLDTNIISYNHEVIVLPAMGSTEYLYSKIQLLQSKINSNDTLFLKAIGIENPKNISLIEIKPIIDIYSFINSTSDKASQNFEFIKLLAEDKDINKVIEDKLTSRNYSRHTLKIKTKGNITEKNTITPLLKYLNDNDYLEKLRNAYIFNINNKILKDEEMILQINNLLNKFSSTSDNQKSDKLIYYNENTQLNEIITSKTNFINDIAAQKVELINMDSFIKKTSVIINSKNTDGVNGKLTLIIPFVFVSVYLFIVFFVVFYKKQSLKAIQNKV
jgi:hypothetical protein